MKRIYEHKGIKIVRGVSFETENADKVSISADKMPINGLSAQQKIILQCVEEKGPITSHQAELRLH